MLSSRVLWLAVSSWSGGVLVMESVSSASGVKTTPFHLSRPVRPRPPPRTSWFDSCRTQRITSARASYSSTPPWNKVQCHLGVQVTSGDMCHMGYVGLRKHRPWLNGGIELPNDLKPNFPKNYRRTLASSTLTCRRRSAPPARGSTSPPPRAWPCSRPPWPRQVGFTDW